jgi:hypothetical protein
MGRLLYVVFDDSNLFGSRKPSASAFFDSSLMMEAVRTSETSVDNYFTRQYNPDDNSEHQKGFYLEPLCPDRLWGPPSLLYNGYRG